MRPFYLQQKSLLGTRWAARTTSPACCGWWRRQSWRPVIDGSARWRKAAAAHERTRAGGALRQARAGMQLSAAEWGDPAGAPVICLHGVTGFGAAVTRVPGVPRRRPAGNRGRPARPRALGLAAAVELEQHVADSSRRPTPSASTARRGLGTASAAGSSPNWRPSPGARRARRPARSAMHIAARSRGERDSSCAPTLVRHRPTRPSTRVSADGALFSTPRDARGEARDHLERDSDGRYRWRFLPAVP